MGLKFNVSVTKRLSWKFTINGFQWYSLQRVYGETRSKSKRLKNCAL